MSTAKDLLVIDVSEVTYCPDLNDPHNPPRDVRDRPPVRDAASTIEQARDLLQRARVPLTASEDDDTPALLAEIAAFLAGATPPEHPLFALVRSFVGKPGDRGPVWGALMRLREHLDETGDLASIEIGDELVAALHERLGQMHDALGRDDTEERTL